VEISKYEFQRLGKIIKEDTLLHKGESERYADFLIVQKRSQIAFFSKDRQSTIKLFDKILILFNKSKNIASIKEVLKAVESRLI
ncbi:MAG: hypothetical protein ABIR18_15990, partial [Chitinophagaceae bacterium]